MEATGQAWEEGQGPHVRPFLPQAPPVHSARRRSYNSVKTWIDWLMQNHCFCPLEFERPFDSASNITCYVSTPGTFEGGVNDSVEFKSFLRYACSERGPNTPQHVMARKIFKSFGLYLKLFCHFGPEPSIMEDLMEKLQGLVVDLRPVLGCPSVYDTAKHMKKLGMSSELPGLCTSGQDGPDNFLKMPLSWKSSGGGWASEGAGVNMWVLLVWASLLGCNHVHCKNTSRFAQSIIKLMARNAPASITPGNAVPIRSFHDQTRENEVIELDDSWKRPDHFLRPIRDDYFASSGKFSICAADEDVAEGLLPEDYICCAAAMEWRKFFKCKKYIDVPPKTPGDYQLIPCRYYCVYSKSKKVWANLWADHNGVTVTDVGESDGEDSGCHYSCMLWQEQLKEDGWLVLPMVWRTGALVRVEGEDRFGCLVPSNYEELNQIGSWGSNYNSSKLLYNVLYSSEEDLSLMSPLDVLDSLVRPGTEVWIKPDTEAWGALAPNMPPLSQGGEDVRMIKARLNIPLTPHSPHGKVVVTVLQREAGLTNVYSIDYRHVTVDPWELSPDPPETDCLEVTELLL